MKKPHPLKGKKRDPEAVRKSRETYKRNRELKASGQLHTTPEERITDAVSYLRAALRKSRDRVESGKLLPTEVLYIQLALKTLLGDI